MFQRNGGWPVILAARTNHALDQLLNLCLDFGASIRRVLRGLVKDGKDPDIIEDIF